MSHLNDLIRQLATKDPALARDIEKEVKALADRRAFGLNFERHTPEAVDLPGRRPVKGSKVRIQPPRGEMPKKENDRLWEIIAIDPVTNPPVASMNALDGSGDINRASVEDLVVVAEFSDPIYPGLVSTGKVERGGDKPFHSVINAENYHALQALLFTHRGKVDCIYIDPPYNTGAKDWKYNNDYVESDDLYRHSKWLAFMERRLLLAKELLSGDGVLVVTIDEHEVHHLGLLLEMILPEFTIQMATAVINPRGVTQGYLSRVEEYVFYCFAPDSVLFPVNDDLLTHREQVSPAKVERPRWKGLLRSGDASLRADRPNMFFPMWISPAERRVVRAGEPIPLDEAPSMQPDAEGNVPAWPIRRDGALGRWSIGHVTANELIDAGFLAAGGRDEARGTWALSYLSAQIRQEIIDGRASVVERHPVTGVADVVYTAGASRRTRTVWHRSSHDAGAHGTDLIGGLLGGGRPFPFPKSLYAVEDTLRPLLAGKPHATVVDFFAGSGTTAHAIARLNHADRGQRRAIIVSNNEVAENEHRGLRKQGLRPGDAEWEKHGICDYITKPRIAAAITGRTPDSDPIKGDYKFTDEFPMADGFEENVEFFTLTYESPLRVEANFAFGRIAPLLWIRAGSQGRRIDELPDGWDVAETYGVISDLDHSEEFARAIAAAPAASVAFVITDEDRLFEALVRELPEHIEPVRLYEAYLRTFEIEARRAAER